MIRFSDDGAGYVLRRPDAAIVESLPRARPPAGP